MAGYGGAGRERRIAREDVLRLLRERGGSASMGEVAEELGDEGLAGEVVGELAGEGLVERSGDRVSLTPRGEAEAEEVHRRHVEAERLLVEAGLVGEAEAHRAAHALEHLPVDLERILAEARGRRVETLYSLEPGASGRVVAILAAEPRILSRLYGVGILPGRPVRLVSKTGSLVVVETGAEARLAALDAGVAKRILVALGG
ncbi:MAG: FeoA domain-containing protein [Desulfurococcales archaeon]|nr:FeoA domain-containing protein [Desulfurococcales archaeon]